MMRRSFFVFALSLWGCGQPVVTPTPPKTEPAKTAPAASAPAASTSAPDSAPAPEAKPSRDLVSAVTANGVEEAQGMGDAEKAAAPAAKTFKNVPLLGELSGGRLMASMQSMSASLGGECESCHKESDFSSDANKHKVVSRRMMEMSFAINRDNFDNKVKVSCYTCHRGQEEPSKAPASAPEAKEPGVSAEDQKKLSGEFFANVQILKDVPMSELKPLMKKFNAALGVRCEFCHVKGEFESDEKPTKVRAREMLKMSAAINATYFPKKKSAVTCDTCHRGASTPAVSVGPSVVVRGEVAGQTSWSAIFGIAKWPELPKTRGAFREALGPIPEGQALVGMLLHSDTGELGHLPPGEYSLCGFALPANKDDDKLKAERPVTCQPITITASPELQSVKLSLPAP